MVSGLNPPVTVSGGNITRILRFSGPGSVKISNLAFTGGVSSGGAALFFTGTDQVILENCHFSENQASGSGGALLITGGGELTIANSTFENNSAAVNGGAISTADAGPALITGSTFAGNSAAVDGGAIYSFAATLINSTLSTNAAGRAGGAIFLASGGIINTTIHGNQAGAGGGIALVGPPLSYMINSTVTSNRAEDLGGGIYINHGSVDVFNSTFAHNMAPNGSEFYLPALDPTSIYNTIVACLPESSSCVDYSSLLSELGMVNSIVEAGTLTDFGLAELADNGGPTQTMALLPGSPLIDAGDDSICASAEVNYLDQRGVARPQGIHCDIGAYEYQPLVRYVKQDVNGTSDGSSWENAHTDLQDALAAASPGEEIWVAAGTYKPTTGTDRTLSFTLKNGVAIYGGFAGTETLLYERDPEANVTILSGDIGVEGDNSDNSYHVVDGSNKDRSATLDGFTITAGNASAGGGIYIYQGSPQLYRLTLTDNHAELGGGMYIEDGSPRLDGLIFTDNHARMGGGLYMFVNYPPYYGIDLVLTNTVFRNNIASGEGGGLATLFEPDQFFPPTSLTLTDVVFENNTAARTGGGMILNGGDLQMLNVTFTGNTAAAGGGMSNFPWKISTLTNVTFSHNSASEAGGGMLSGGEINSSNDLHIILTNVTFDNNSTPGSGGGIHHHGGPLYLTNVTFSRNEAGTRGGGISNGGFFSAFGGVIDVTNATFSENAATGDGDALYN